MGTEADFAGAYRRASSAKSKRWVLPVVIISVVALMIAVGELSGLLNDKELKNPILYIAEGQNDKKNKHRSYRSGEAFYWYNDTKNFFEDSDFKWKRKTEQQRVGKIEKEYGKVDAGLTIIKKKKGNYYISMVVRKELKELEIKNQKIVVQTAFEILKECHEKPNLTPEDTRIIERAYRDIKGYYEDETDQIVQEHNNDGGQGQGDGSMPEDKYGDEGLLAKLQGLDRFMIIEGKVEEKLKNWKDAHSLCEAWLLKDESQHLDKEDRKEYIKDVDAQLIIWIDLIENEVLTHVGALPPAYRKADEIRRIEDLKEIKEWLQAYKLLRGRIDKDLAAMWGHLPRGLTKGRVIEKLDKKFRGLTGLEDEKRKMNSEVPGRSLLEFNKLLEGQKLLITERGVAERAFKSKTRDEIDNMLPEPYDRTPAKTVLGEITCFYARPGGKKLVLHFTYDYSIKDYRVDKVELKRPN